MHEHWIGLADTVGAVGSLCIYKHFLKEDFRNETGVMKGLDWIGKNFTVTENPKAHEDWQKGAYYYYLYGLERAGILYNTEKFGTHEWYPEGANKLLDAQEPDGKWKNVEDTCFAVLFLKRGMKPLIHTGAGKSGK